MRIAILVYLFYFAGCNSIQSTNAEKSYVIAHMTNTKGTVRWALDNGAVGVELDLNFDRCGNLLEFRHGGACDCSCLCATNGRECDPLHICHQLWIETGSHCGAGTGAIEMLEFLASPGIREKLSIIYIDSKLDYKLIEYYKAGLNTVRLINEKLFDQGYTGQVIINGNEFKYIEYLRGAMDEAKGSKYGDKYFYTFDGEGKDYNKAWNGLVQLNTTNLFYSTGISACLKSTRFDEAIKYSVAKGTYAGIGIWTLDKQSTINSYLEIGATAIITNVPAVGVKSIHPYDRLQPGEQALWPKDSKIPGPTESNFTWECDCNYHKGESIWGGGGCTIETPPPPGKACKCYYTGAWLCKGENIVCPNPFAPTCEKPDMSKATCAFGGGDCKGYQC